MHGTRDAENNHRDYGIEGLGLGRDDRVRNPIVEPRNSSEHSGTSVTSSTVRAVAVH